MKEDTILLITKLIGSPWIYSLRKVVTSYPKLQQLTTRKRPATLAHTR